MRLDHLAVGAHTEQIRLPRIGAQHVCGVELNEQGNCLAAP
jgi:hypothetical protein